MATIYRPMETIYRPRTTELLNDDLPGRDALTDLLSSPQHYIFTDPDITSANETNRNESTGTTMGAVDQQKRELDKYRNALRAMGLDNLILRKKISALETENALLRRKHSNFDDLSKFSPDTSDYDNVDGLIKPEILTQYAIIKHKLAERTSQLSIYKERVCKLQNDLIKKNDERKEIQGSQGVTGYRAAKTESELLHSLERRSQRIRALEETCRKQEFTIEKVEKILELRKANLPDITKDGRRRMWEEITDLQISREKATVHKLTQKSQKLLTNETRKESTPRLMHREKLLLQKDIETSEARIRYLERQKISRLQQNLVNESLRLPTS